MKRKHESMSIGMVAARCGCKVQTIRYYEQIGLMHEPERSEGGQRRYDWAQVQRLDLIRHSRELGFSIEAIRHLLELTDSRPASCDAVDTLASAHPSDIKGKISQLQDLQAELEKMLGRCRGGAVHDCQVMAVLADHSHCLQIAHLLMS